MKRETKINQAKERAKNTRVSFIGVNIAKLDLTDEEKRQLISEGFYFSANRKKETSLHYSQISRVTDLKEKVNKRTEEKDYRNCATCNEHIFYFYKNQQGTLSIKNIQKWSERSNFYICLKCLAKKVEKEDLK